MKIAQVCPKYLPEHSGITTHVREISERLIAKGHEVEVYTTDPTGKLEKETMINNVPIKRYKSWAPLHVYYFSMSLLSGLKKSDCEILHVHGYQDFPLAAGLIAKRDRKCLVTLHSGWPLTPITRMFNLPYRFIVGKTLACVDRVIFVSKYELRYFSSLCRFSPSKVVILPNGVNIKRFQGMNRWPSALPPKTKYILSVSGLRKYKGHDFLIKGFALANSLRKEGTKLVIAGTGDCRYPLEKLAKNLGLEREVFIIDTPNNEEIDSLYRNCELFVLLSRFESQGISVADAITARKPVIVSLTPGLADYVFDGYARGVPYPPKTSELANILEETISEASRFTSMNPELLDWNQVTNRLERIYETVIDS